MDTQEFGGGFHYSFRQLAPPRLGHRVTAVPGLLLSGTRSQSSKCRSPFPRSSALRLRVRSLQDARAQDAAPAPLSPGLCWPHPPCALPAPGGRRLSFVPLRALSCLTLAWLWRASQRWTSRSFCGPTALLEAEIRVFRARMLPLPTHSLLCRSRAGPSLRRVHIS